MSQQPPAEELQMLDADQAAIAVGEVLRRAREERGESLGEASGVLKLTLRQMEAMECGRLDLLPGPAFVRGFLRNYARHLGLDPAPLLDMLEPGGPAAVELAPVTNAEGTMPNGAGAQAAARPMKLLVVLLLAALLLGWYFDWFSTPGDEEVAAPVPSAPEVVPLFPPQDGTGEGGAAAVPDTGEAESAPVAPAPLEAPVPAEAPAAVEAAPPATEGRLDFGFSGESWVEVRDAKGAVLFSGIGRAGASRSVQGTPPFALVVGNAREVTLQYNGKAVDLTPHTRVSVARLTLQ